MRNQALDACGIRRLTQCGETLAIKSADEGVEIQDPTGSQVLNLFYFNRGTPSSFCPIGREPMFARVCATQKEDGSIDSDSKKHLAMGADVQKALVCVDASTIMTTTGNQMM